jgi:hypothetical protein
MNNEKGYMLLRDLREYSKITGKKISKMLFWSSLGRVVFSIKQNIFLNIFWCDLCKISYFMFHIFLVILVHVNSFYILCFSLSQICVVETNYLFSLS